MISIHTYNYRGNMDYLIELRCEDGIYVAECPYFKACYSSGGTIGEALDNIIDVIKMCLAEVEIEGAEEVLEPEYSHLQIEDIYNINIYVKIPQYA